MKRPGTVIAAAALVMLGLAFVHPFGNPRVESAQGLDTLLLNANMPADAKHVLITKCADCHSNEARWPVYARVAPGSWLIERDIIEARKKMNLSLWNELPADAQEVLIGKIIHEAKEGSMPPAQYRVLHWGAKLTTADIATLTTMMKAGQLETASSDPGDAARGKIAFEKRCTGCHAMDADREGPRLSGVFGRKAGGVAGFDYSGALKNSGLTWDDATLEKWLSDPDTLVPNNKMDFHVPKAQERSDLIAYFKK